MASTWSKKRKQPVKNYSSAEHLRFPAVAAVSFVEQNAGHINPPETICHHILINGSSRIIDDVVDICLLGLT
jgi:hypothetical protein